MRRLLPATSGWPRQQHIHVAEKDTQKEEWNRATYLDMQLDLANQAEYLCRAHCTIVGFATELSMPVLVMNLRSKTHRYFLKNQRRFEKRAYDTHTEV